MQSMEWFRNESMSQFAPWSGMILGGRRLLKEFAESVTAMGGRGRLSIAVPFMENDLAWLATEWTSLPHASIRLRAVTRPSCVGTITHALGQFKWRSISVIAREDIHAKVYGFATDCGRGVCLIGSHNLTNAAMTRNNEFGVMYRCASKGPELNVVNACLSYIDML